MEESKMAKKKKEVDPFVESLLDQISFKGLTQDDLLGNEGLVKQLTKRILEKALDSEMDHHLGYEKNDAAG